jgi:hypothetical protein
MKYQQRDLVMVSLELPDGKIASHPYLIISCESANRKENFYSAVMLTSSVHKDTFSIEVDDLMFESPLRKKDCQIRLFIISSFNESKVQTWMNRMKKIHFKAVLDQLKEFVLSID